MKLFKKLWLFTACIALWFIPACKKNTSEKPDYSCNCGQYGKNLATFRLDRPLALIPFYDVNKKYGFMNNSGSVIVNPQYHEAFRFSNNRALIIDNSNGKEFAGFLNEEGNMAIQPKYRYVAPFFSKEGLLPVGNLLTWKLGYIDRDGNLKIPYKYNLVFEFHDGLATVSEVLLQGAVDTEGNLKIPMEYAFLGTFNEGLAFAITPNGRHGYIDKGNQFVIEGEFTEGGLFVDGLTWVNDPISHLYGFIRRDGSYLADPIYEEADNFWEGFAAVKSKGKWGFISNSGAISVSFQFEAVNGGFSEGLAAVKKNGKWGYINFTGSFQINPEYDDVDVFCCGVALVYYIDGTYGFINRDGKSVWRSTYQSLKSGFRPPDKISCPDSGFQYR